MRLLSRSAPSSPRTRRSRAGRIALVALLGLVIFCVAFDWNWCRPLIRHYVMSRSGRSVEFDDLKVHFRDGFDPTIEFRGLTIENAHWANTKAPFLHAGRAAATISWRTLGSDLTVIRLVELDDAQVDMERLANGIRNWRITRPEDIGPPRVQVLALDARRSQLHMSHGGIGLVLDASTTPLPVPLPFAGHPDLPLTKSLTFRGRFRDDAFDGDARTSDVLAFGTLPRMFSFTAHARSGALTVEASGLSNDAHALADFDCDVKLSASSGGPVKPLPEALARLRPLAAAGHLAKQGDRWTGSAVRLRAGRQTTLVADAVFTGNLKSATPRRTLTATLRDAVIDLDDAALLRGEPATGVQAGGAALSKQPLPLEKLRDFDAVLDLRPAQFVGTGHVLAQSLRAQATLASGVLDVKSLDAGLADGHVTGTLQVDASHAPAVLSLDLSARGLHIDQFAANGAFRGAVDGRATLTTQGESARAFAANANGSVTVALAEGATVSKRFDAKLGLNGGEWLRTLFDKSARVPVQCAGATLALDHGIVTSRRFVFETPDTALAAQGSLDLANETVDVTLTPLHKKLALLSLDRSIHAEGAWRDVKIALKPAQDVAPTRCDAVR
jgi:uncharacterized protein involved in outer membrane biogenesis